MTLDLAQLVPLPDEVKQLRAEVAELRALLLAAGTPNDPNERITVEQASKEAHLSPAALYKLIARGKVKRYPIAGSHRRYLVRRGDVLRGGA